MTITKPSDKLSKVDESFTVYKYDNGFLVEVSGRNKDDDWATSKILVSSLEEIFELITDINSLPRE